MTKMNESAIRTGIAMAVVNNSPVKLKFKESNNFDSYFGTVLDVNEDDFAIEYHDYVDIVKFSELDNLIS